MIFILLRYNQIQKKVGFRDAEYSLVVARCGLMWAKQVEVV